MNATALGLLFGCFLATTAQAAPTALREDDPWVVETPSFVRAHPDLRFRKVGMEAYRRGRFVDAYRYFRDASRYADKSSQAMVAEMLWKGEGVAQDRALAYAWMDLAAERHYPALLAQRERYWSELNATERALAIEIGQSVFAEFADTVAKPRLERVLSRARTQITGSRVGYVGNLVVPGALAVPTEGGALGIDALRDVVDGSKYYAAQYWESKTYWNWQDAQWRRYGEGHVEVGAPQPAGDAKPPI